MPRVAKKVASRAPAAKAKSKSRRVPRYAVRGRGGYTDNVKARWSEGGGPNKGLFEAAGGAVGGPVGSFLGGLINRGLYAITGFGDYKVMKNSLIETNGPPTVINSGKEFIIRHREFVQDIYSGTGTAGSQTPFNLQAFPINPGVANLFPWLANLASQFEQYRLEGMVLEYKSMYSDAVTSANGALGTVILATEYNAGAPLFPNKQSMENHEFAQSAKPSLSILHPIECARSQSVLNELYVRTTGVVPSGQDIKTFDFGTFQIASQGVPLAAGSTQVLLGELWCTYQISLFKPRVSVGSSAGYVDSGWAHWIGQATSGTFATTGPLSTTLPTAWTLQSSSNIDMTLQNFQISILRLPYNMSYLFTLNHRSIANTNAAGWTSAYVNNVTNGSLISDVVCTGPYMQTPQGATATVSGCSLTFAISVPASTASGQRTVITLQPMQCPNTTDQVRCDLLVNALPQPLN